MAANSYNLLLFSSLDLSLSLLPSLSSLSTSSFSRAMLPRVVASFPSSPRLFPSFSSFAVATSATAFVSYPSFLFIELLLFPRAVFPRCAAIFALPARAYVPASRACLCLICLPLHFTHPAATTYLFYALASFVRSFVFYFLPSSCPNPLFPSLSLSLSLSLASSLYYTRLV